MAAFNITPIASTNGIPYAVSIPLTSTEADLNGGTDVPVSPIPIAYGQAIVAVVQLSVNGLVGANATYVVMQTDMGDGVWIDVAWAYWGGLQGSATFVLSGGGLGTMNNAFQQSRQLGFVPAPAASGSNAIPLAGRVRFVGKTTFTGGSSSLAGLTTQVSATIRYKMMTPN